MSNDKARILTVSELSEYLHVHRTTIYRMLREGNLPGFRIGSDWRFNLDAIEQWQRDHTNTIREGGVIYSPDDPGAPATPIDRDGFVIRDSALEVPHIQPLPIGRKRPSGRARRP
jgi:excisionase family DNA binding protein